MDTQKKNSFIGYDPQFGEISRLNEPEHQISFILNQRWTLVVLNHLTDGPIRFNALTKVTGINPNTLRDRLRVLEIGGLVTREVLSLMPPRVEYSLSRKGAELNQILLALNRWLRDNSTTSAVVKPAVEAE